jgi:membrane dipeptidase
VSGRTRPERFKFKLSANEEQRAIRLHREATIVDTLGDALQQDSIFFSEKMEKVMKRLIEKKTPRTELIEQMHVLGMDELLKEEERNKEYLGWWRESGVNAASVTVGPWGRIPFSFENALRDLARWTRKFDSLDFLIKIGKAKDILDAKGKGRKGIILNFQNTTHIGRDLEKINFFYQLGIRIIQLTYNEQNDVGDGCMEKRDCGLSKFGLKVIHELNRLGILIDLSHSGLATTVEAIEMSKSPVAITHSFCYALHNHPRGKTDEVMKKLSEREGYLGIALLPAFLSSKEEVDLEAFLDHVDHAVKIMGPGRIGIGTDTGQVFPPSVADELDKELIEKLGFQKTTISGYNRYVAGFENWMKWPNLTRGLVSRGYTDEEIMGILGGNFIRVFREVVG